MNRSTLVFLLGLSLIFNVFFVIGAMTWRISEVDNEADIVKDVVDKLELDSRQADAFRLLRKADQSDTRVIRDQLTANHETMMEILSSETPDINRLRTLANEDIELRSELHKVHMDNHLGLVKLLTPQQRQRLAKKLIDGRPARHGGRDRRVFSDEIIKKFDVDQNGKLDKDEWHQAREFSKQQHRARRDRVREIQQRFDLDKDGRLDREEEDAMRLFLLENGMENPPHPPPGRRNGPPRDNPPHHGDSGTAPLGSFF